MADDLNNTSSRWLAFHRSLAWIRQGRPGVTDEGAYNVLRLALINEVCEVSEGVPIDKFRYPRAGRMIDLVVLIRNKYLTFEDIRWQNVECNLDWLERDWPLALEAEAAPVPTEDAALKPIEPAAAESAPAAPPPAPAQTASVSSTEPPRGEPAPPAPRPAKRTAGRPRAAWLNALYDQIDGGQLDQTLTNGDIARRFMGKDNASPKPKTILNVLATDKKFAAWREKKVIYGNSGMSLRKKNNLRDGFTGIPGD